MHDEIARERSICDTHLTSCSEELSMSPKRVREIPRILQGRDFVVGDVRGCSRTLERALAILRFDARCDRLFGVGDLVDRGPHCNEAVDWLEHRFEAVTLGNHDRAALSWLEAKLNGSRAAGEDWKQTLALDEYPPWRDALRKMPFALTIGTPYGPVGVVHGKAPDPDWSVPSRCWRLAPKPTLTMCFSGSSSIRRPFGR